MGARDDRKVTPGITELSRLRAHIDGAACYIDVGSSYPGRAEMHETAMKKIKLSNEQSTVSGQGWGCSPVKRDRELGSERCETVCLIATGIVRNLRGRDF